MPTQKGEKQDIVNIIAIDSRDVDPRHSGSVPDGHTGSAILLVSVTSVRAGAAHDPA